MSPSLLYQIASGLLVFFSIGHTMGLLGSKKKLPVKGKVVKASMDKVRFKYMGADCSWGGFYLGFGLLTTVFLLFSAVLSWNLSTLVQTNPGQLSFLAWAFFASQAANRYLSWKYFFALPGVISSLVVLCAGLAAWQLV